MNWLSARPSDTPIFTSSTQRVTTPTTPDTYNYQCRVHGARMPGTVIVQ